MVTHTSNSSEQTEAIAASLAQQVRAGDCIALDGQLGAGKTQFVRGLLRALGGDPQLVSSPTYVLLNIYRAPRLTVYHLDAYRVGGADDLEAIGFSELLEQGGIVVVEWAERVRSLLPERCIRIQIEVISPSAREISIEGSGR